MSYQYDAAGAEGGGNDLATVLGFAGDVLPSMINAYAARQNSGDVAPAYRTGTSQPAQATSAISSPVGKTVLIVGAIALFGVALFVGARMMRR